MGLTLVKDEETGVSRYEYRPNTQPEEQEIDIPRQNFGQALTDLSPFSALQSDLAEGLSAKKDDNALTGTIKTIGRIPYNAAVNALQEGSDTVRDLGEWTGVAPEGTGTTADDQDKGIIGLGGWKPVEADNSEANLEGVENFATGVVQFGLEWVTLSKALRGVNWSLKASKVPALVKAGKVGTKIAQVEKNISSGYFGAPVVGAAFNATANPKGLLIDFAGFNQWDGRLYDLAANSEWFGFVKDIPLVNQLESDPSDTAMEGRLKNMVEGWGIDFGIGSGIKGYKASVKDGANLLVNTTKARGYSKKLFEAAQTFGEGSPQYNSILRNINNIGKKIRENPIIKRITGEESPSPERIEQLPSAKEAFETKQIDDQILEVQAQIKQLGTAPPKPEKGTYFELLPGNNKKTKTPAAVAYARDKKIRDRLTKELNELTGQKETSQTPKQEITEELGPEPLEPTARKNWDRKRAEKERSQTPATPIKSYTREQTLRAEQAVNALVDPKTKKPLTADEKAVVTQRFLETKFGRLNKQATKRNRYYGGMTQEQYARAIEQRVLLINEIIKKVGGKDVQYRWHDRYGKGKGTAEYGQAGQKVSLEGTYDFLDDVLDIYGLMSGTTQDLAASVYHEIFHRIQLTALDNNQLKVLDSVWARFKVAVANERTLHELDLDKLAYIEGMTYAFERYGAAKLFGKDPIKALLPDPISHYSKNPTLYKITTQLISLFDPILDLIEKTYNYITDPKGKGFRSIRSVFEEAYQGKFADVVQPKSIEERAALKAAGGNSEGLLNVDGFLNNPERQLIHPGGLWRTRDEGYRKLNPKEADMLDIWTRRNTDQRLAKLGGRRFSLPEGKWGGQNYGQAKITFESDLDRVAWIIRRGKEKLPKTTQTLIDLLEDAGFDIEEIRDLGEEIHQQIKTGIKDATGTAQAGPNTAGLELNIPSSTYDVADGFELDELADRPMDDGEPAPRVEADTQVNDSKYVAREENISGYTEDLMDNIENYADGKLEYKDLYNDIVSVESKPTANTPEGGRMTFGPATTNMLLLWDAVSRRFDRLKATNMPSVDIQQIADDIVKDATERGINAAEIEGLNKGLAGVLFDNVRNVENLIKLRLVVHLTSEEAGKKAMQLMNAMKASEINWSQASSELQHAVAAAVQISRTYQTITRGVGQLLVTTQAELKNIDGIELVQSPKPSFKVDPETLIKEIETTEQSLAQGGSLEGFMPPELLEAIKTNKWDAKTKQMMYQLANVVAEEATNPGVGINSIDSAVRGPQINTKQLKDAPEVATHERWGRTLSGYRVNNLLSAPLTWAVQTGIPTTRMVTEPVYDFMNRLTTRRGIIPLKEIKQNLDITGRWYWQMWMESMGALRIGRQSFMTGQTLVDPYRRSSAWDLNTYKAVQEAEGIAERGMIDENNPAYNLNEMPIFRELGKSPRQIAIKNWLWKAATFDIRTQGAIESTQKAIATRSFLYADGIGEGLEQAAREGLEGKDAWFYAEEWAKSKVQFFTHDAVVRGVEVTDALMTHPAALKFGRMLTFTDDVRALMPQRTIAYGQDLAREIGIKGDKEINDFAIKYKNGLVDKSGKEMTTPLNMPGERTPSITGAWSYLPRKWGEFQRSSRGYIASMIQPFNRSPGDITKQFIRMVPGANLTVDTFYRDLLDENSYFANRWKGEVATGATVATALMVAFNNDNIQITGSGPAEPEAYRLWRSQNQHDSIRFKIGTDPNGDPIWGGWTSYRNYEPAASLIRMIADMKAIGPELTRQQKDTLGAALVVQIAWNVVTGRFRSSYYEGIADFADAALSTAGAPGAKQFPTQPGEASKFQRYFEKLAVSFAPRSSHLRTLTQAIDPYKRVTPTGRNRNVLDPEGEKVFEFEGDNELMAQSYRYKTEGNLLGNAFESFFNQLKANTPLWSKTLPPRRNWITYDPLLNPGFLGSNQMPLADEPWYAQLSNTFLLTALPAGLSLIPVVGSLPQIQGRPGRPDAGPKDYVMNELMRLRGMGSNFVAPRPSEIQKGARLSAPAYDQYLKYIAATPMNDPNSAHNSLLLHEALWKVMSTDLYQNAPADQEGDSYILSERMNMLKPIIDEYKKQGKFLFLNSNDNPYILEVLMERQRQTKGELQNELGLQLSEPTLEDNINTKKFLKSPSLN